MDRRTVLRCESLEPRLARAGLVQFFDQDGDLVTVRSSHSFNEGLAAALTLVPTGYVGGAQLQRVLLNAPGFAGTSLSIVAQPSTRGGNGRVDVGEISSPHDLGDILVGGDLGRITAGDRNLATVGLGSFQAVSIGMRSTATGAPDTASRITGGMRSMKLDGNLTGAMFQVVGHASDVTIGGSIVGVATYDGFIANSIGTIVVRGGLYGGNTYMSGRLESSFGGIGQVRVYGDLVGGGGELSGQVAAAGPIGLAWFGGSITGSSGASSGRVFAGPGGITRLAVAGSIFGGGSGGPMAGGVGTLGSIGSALVGGSIVGGGDSDTGCLTANRGIGTLDVVGDIQGGLGAGSGRVIVPGGAIGTVRLRSILAGDGSMSGGLAAAVLGNVVVRGNIAGSTFQFAHVTAVGGFRPEGPRAINSLTVGGTVSRANVFGGYTETVAPVNGAARIGAVTVGGGFFSSNLVAGARNLLTPGRFGNSGDVSIGGTGASRIESLVVNGIAAGNYDPSDSYGVVARTIGSVRIGTRNYVVPTGPGIAPNGDNLRIRRV